MGFLPQVISKIMGKQILLHSKCHMPWSPAAGYMLMRDIMTEMMPVL